MAYIISADDFKQTLPGYDPARASDFHRASAKLADQAYQDALSNNSAPRVILMAGGAASGKSEYVSGYLASDDAIIVDGTLPTIAGAAIKIKKAEKAGKVVEVQMVMPANFTVAYAVFLNRERKFASQHFYRTHINSRKTVLTLAEQFPRIPITIIESDVMFVGEGGMMHFRMLEFPNRSSLIDFLLQNQYGESDIRAKILSV